MNRDGIYVVMYQNTPMAEVNMSTRTLSMLPEGRLPIGMKFEEDSDDMNFARFESWCERRMGILWQDRAEEVSASMGLTLRKDNLREDRVAIALAYHCASIADCFWVREKDENINWEDVSMFIERNDCKSEQYASMSPCGKNAKTVRYIDGEMYLDKATDRPYREILAGRLLEALGVSHVFYEPVSIGDRIGTRCRLFTNEECGFAPFREMYHTYLGVREMIKKVDLTGYANLAVGTYLLGNTGMYEQNWGVLFDGKGRIKGMAPQFNFDECFLDYNRTEKTYYFPECSFVDRNVYDCYEFLYHYHRKELLYIDGPVLKEAALRFIAGSSINADGFNADEFEDSIRELPECLRIWKQDVKEEFCRRLESLKNVGSVMATQRELFE